VSDVVSKLVKIHELLHLLFQCRENLKWYEQLVSLDEYVIKHFGKDKKALEDLKSHQKMLSNVESEIRNIEKEIASLLKEMSESLASS